MKITLYSSYNPDTHRFAICDHDGTPIQYGPDFKNIDNNIRNGELNAALKAIQTARKILNEHEFDHISLKLYVTSSWMLEANKYSVGDVPPSERVQTLAEAAFDSCVHLTIETTQNNLAYQYTCISGYLKL